jgi:hypothetical protein
MWKMRLVVCLILLLAIGMTAAAENEANKPGESEVMGKPPAAAVVKTSGPGMAVKLPGEVPASAAPDADKAQKAVTPDANKTATSPPTGRPVAIIDNNLYTFPAVMEGEEVVHDFVFRNAGDAPLLIEQVSAG